MPRSHCLEDERSLPRHPQPMPPRERRAPPAVVIGKLQQAVGNHTLQAALNGEDDSGFSMLLADIAQRGLAGAEASMGVPGQSPPSTIRAHRGIEEPPEKDALASLIADMEESVAMLGSGEGDFVWSVAGLEQPLEDRDTLEEDHEAQSGWMEVLRAAGQACGTEMARVMVEDERSPPEGAAQAPIEPDALAVILADLGETMSQLDELSRQWDGSKAAAGLSQTGSDAGLESAEGEKGEGGHALEEPAGGDGEAAESGGGTGDGGGAGDGAAGGEPISGLAADDGGVLGEGEAAPGSSEAEGTTGEAADEAASSQVDSATGDAAAEAEDSGIDNATGEAAAEAEATAGEVATVTESAASETATAAAPDTESEGASEDGSASGMLLALLENILPELAAFLDQGPQQAVQDLLEGALGDASQSLLGGLSLDQLATSVQGMTDEAEAQLAGAASGGNACCGDFPVYIEALAGFVQGVLESPVFEAMGSLLGSFNDGVLQLSELLLAPGLELLQELLGEGWAVAQQLMDSLSGWISTAQTISSEAWDYVAAQLGITGEGDVSQSFTQWCAEAWDSIRRTLAPVLEPLQALSELVYAISPMGQVMLMIQAGQAAWEAGSWLLEHWDDEDLWEQALEALGDEGMLGQLAQLLTEAGDQASAGAAWLSEGFTALADSADELSAAVCGQPLLSAGAHLVQALSAQVGQLRDFGSQQLQAAAARVAELAAAVWEWAQPWLEVASSIALCVFCPAFIPQVLAGWAWAALCDCSKEAIIDFLLDVLIAALDAAPDLPFFGLLWSAVKPGVLGFLTEVRGQDAETKVAMADRFAAIMRGSDLDFIFGFVKGLLLGMWQGLTDPFVLAWTLVEGMGSLAIWASDLAEGAGEGREAEAQETDGDAPTQDLQASASQMWTELSAQAEPVISNFMPALEEHFSSGSGMSFEDLAARLGELWTEVQDGIEGAGEALAQELVAFFVMDEASGDLGEALGWLAGTVIFEVLLALCTAGLANTVTTAGKALKLILKVVDWTGEALGAAFKLLGQLGGHVIDLVKGLGGLVSSAGGGAVKSVMEGLSEIGELLVRYAEELLGLLGKGADDAVEVVAEKGAREGVEEAAELGGETALEQGDDVAVSLGVEQADEGAGSVKTVQAEDEGTEEEEEEEEEEEKEKEKEEQSDLEPIARAAAEEGWELGSGRCRAELLGQEELLEGFEADHPADVGVDAEIATENRAWSAQATAYRVQGPSQQVTIDQGEGWVALDEAGGQHFAAEDQTEKHEAIIAAIDQLADSEALELDAELQFPEAILWALADLTESEEDQAEGDLLQGIRFDIVSTEDFDQAEQGGQPGFAFIFTPNEKKGNIYFSFSRRTWKDRLRWAYAVDRIAGQQEFATADWAETFAAAAMGSAVRRDTAMALARDDLNSAVDAGEADRIVDESGKQRQGASGYLWTLDQLDWDKLKALITAQFRDDAYGDERFRKNGEPRYFGWEDLGAFCQDHEKLPEDGRVDGEESSAYEQQGKMDEVLEGLFMEECIVWHPSCNEYTLNDMPQERYLPAEWIAGDLGSTIRWYYFLDGSDYEASRKTLIEEAWSTVAPLVEDFEQAVEAGDAEAEEEAQEEWRGVAGDKEIRLWIDPYDLDGIPKATKASATPDEEERLAAGRIPKGEDRYTEQQAQAKREAYQQQGNYHADHKEPLAHGWVKKHYKTTYEERQAFGGEEEGLRAMWGPENLAQGAEYTDPATGETTRSQYKERLAVEPGFTVLGAKDPIWDADKRGNKFRATKDA